MPNALTDAVNSIRYSVDAATAIAVELPHPELAKDLESAAELSVETLPVNGVLDEENNKEDLQLAIKFKLQSIQAGDPSEIGLFARPNCFSTHEKCASCCSCDDQGGHDCGRGTPAARYVMCSHAFDEKNCMCPRAKARPNEMVLNSELNIEPEPAVEPDTAALTLIKDIEYSQQQTLGDLYPSEWRIKCSSLDKKCEFCCDCGEGPAKPLCGNRDSCKEIYKGCVLAVSKAACKCEEE